MTLTPGQIINNRYRIEALIGQGGFGAVYRAWDFNLERYCALKENLNTSPNSQTQFKREAKILADLSHPNLPRVIDHFIIPEQGQYMAMDFVEGENLQEKLNRQGGSPLPEAQVLPWMLQAIGALDYLHTQTPPVIHRDIKPANIVIQPDGRAVLVDFGIAKVFYADAHTVDGAKAIASGYSAPEQYGGESTDVRSDIYSLGATLYHLLTGVRPPDSTKLAGGTATLILPSQFNNEISPRVEKAILTCLEADANRRFQKITELWDALAEPAQTTTGPKTFPRVLIAAAAAIALALICGAVMGIGYFSGIFRNDPTATFAPSATFDTTETARVEIVYRSPEEMNLKPEDVPELIEVEPEYTADEPLLPEAVDQDQTAFQSPEGDIYVESSVIVVPERPKKSPKEIIDIIIGKRPRPPQPEGSEKECEVGESCSIIEIIDEGCGRGKVMISIRNNIITIIFACGSGVDDDFIKHIGIIVDDKIKKPPNLIEIPSPVKTVDRPAPSTDVCFSQSLTSEECANVGTHVYKLVSCIPHFKLTDTGWACNCPTDFSQWTFTLDNSFSKGIFRSQTIGAYVNAVWNKVGYNTYKTQVYDKGITADFITIFLNNGYSQNSYYEGVLCQEYTYVIEE